MKSAYVCALGVLALLFNVSAQAITRICGSHTVPFAGLSSSQSKSGVQNSAIAVIGSTPVEVHARFPAIIEQNMRSDTNIKLHGDKTHQALSAEELANLAALYNHASNNSGTLLQIFAENADADGLTRVAAAFGQEATTKAVQKYANPAVALAFVSSPIRSSVAATIAPSLSTPVVISSGAMLQGSVGYAFGLPPGAFDMTIYEIYLDFRTAPVGALSVGSALAETSIGVGGALAFAWGLGYGFGTLFNNFINSYFPDVGRAIGDALGNSVQWLENQVQQGVSTLQEGNDEYSIDNVISTLGIGYEPYTSSGDWGVSSAMAAASVSC